MPLAHADVTVRYHSEIGQPAMVPVGPGPDPTIRIKGNRGLAAVGGISLILDFARQEITVVDAAHQAFTTIPASEYSRQMSAAFPDAAGMDSMKEMLDMIKDSTKTRKT